MMTWTRISFFLFFILISGSYLMWHDVGGYSFTVAFEMLRLISVVSEK